MDARQIVERIAPNEAAMLDSLFNPVEFSDGTKGTYSGFIVKVTKTQVRFTWGCHKQLMVNKHGVVGQWHVMNGKTFYHYVLDPFGPCRYSAECEAGQLLSKKVAP